MHAYRAMQDANQTSPSSSRVGKLRTFAREHPALTALGLGGIGLVAGAELAGGMLLGAGITALLRRQDGHEAHHLREKSRALVDRMPHVVRERARAVVDAVRGKPPAQPEKSEKPEASSSSAVEAPFA